MSWYDKMVAAGRSKSLTTGNVRCRVAAVDEVLGSLALEIPVNCHSELIEDSLRNVEPVQLGVEQTCQASVELTRQCLDQKLKGQRHWGRGEMLQSFLAHIFAKNLLINVIHDEYDPHSVLQRFVQ